MGINEKIQHSAAKGMRLAILGIVVNAALAFIKGAAGILGNSYALLADAIESSLDIFSSLIVWIGLFIAVRPADHNHPYGHGKAEPIAAMVVSFGLFAAAIAIAVQSIREIHTPHHVPAPFTLIVLIIVVITKELLFRFVFSTGESIQSTAVKTDAWHHRSDALTSVAAFIGITIALLGGERFASADSWAALFASGIIVSNAYRLFRPALDEAMDTVPSNDIEIEVREIAGKVKGVVGLDKCLVRKMGFSYYIDLHIIVDRNITVYEGHNIAHAVKDAIRQYKPPIADVLIHIEPN